MNPDSYKQLPAFLETLGLASDSDSSPMGVFFTIDKPVDGLSPNPIDLPPGCLFQNRCFQADDNCRQNAPSLVEVEKGHFIACHQIDGQ